MSPELANESYLSMSFDIPSVWIEAYVIMDNLDLPFHLMKKASVYLDVTTPALTGDQGLQARLSSRTIRAPILVTNKGMTAASGGVQVDAYIDDGSKRVHASALIDRLDERSTASVVLTFHDISTETFGVMQGLWGIMADRVGLPITIELTTEDGYSQTIEFYYPYDI